MTCKRNYNQSVKNFKNIFIIPSVICCIGLTVRRRDGRSRSLSDCTENEYLGAPSVTVHGMQPVDPGSLECWGTATDWLTRSVVSIVNIIFELEHTIFTYGLLLLAL